MPLNQTSCGPLEGEEECERDLKEVIPGSCEERVRTDMMGEVVACSNYERTADGPWDRKVQDIAWEEGDRDSKVPGDERKYTTSRSDRLDNTCRGYTSRPQEGEDSQSHCFRPPVPGGPEHMRGIHREAQTQASSTHTGAQGEGSSVLKDQRWDPGDRFVLGLERLPTPFLQRHC